MNEYYVIENRGECSPELFITFGASSKEKDSKKIGYFGSGGKYALSCLLREEIKFFITTGNNLIILKTKDKTLKAANGGDVNIETIVALINQKEVDLHGFSSGFGKHSWDLKKAIHELVSNAIDEEDGRAPRIFLSDFVGGSPNVTRIFIENTPETYELFERLKYYFFCLDDELNELDLNKSILRIPHNEDSKRGRGHFARNGRRYSSTYENGQVSIWSDVVYNLPFEINELREIPSWEAKSRVIKYYLENPENPYFHLFFGANVVPLSRYTPKIFDFIESANGYHWIETDQKRIVLERIVKETKTPKGKLILLSEDEVKELDPSVLRTNSSVYVMSNELYKLLDVEESKYVLDRDDLMAIIQGDLDLEPVWINDTLLTNICHQIYPFACESGYLGFNYYSSNSLPETFKGKTEGPLLLNGEKLVIPNEYELSPEGKLIGRDPSARRMGIIKALFPGMGGFSLLQMARLTEKLILSKLKEGSSPESEREPIKFTPISKEEETLERMREGYHMSESN